MSDAQDLTAYVAALMDDIPDDQRNRIAELARRHEGGRGVVGDLMAVRCLDSAELAYIAGAFAAAATAAVASVRQSLGQLFSAHDLLSDGNGESTTLPLRDMLHILKAKRALSPKLADSLMVLSDVEERYFAWQTPFEAGTLEVQMRKEGEEDGRPRDAIADAHEVMRRDALSAINLATDLLPP